MLTHTAGRELAGVCGRVSGGEDMNLVVLRPGRGIKRRHNINGLMGDGG